MKTKYKALLMAAFLFGVGTLVAYGAGLLYVDDSGNFGIGNTTPAHKLDVSGALYSRLVTLEGAATVAVDWNDGNVQALTFDRASTTLTFSNAQAGGEYKLILKQDSTGNRTITWPESVKWEGGTVPTLTTTANAIDSFSFVYDGTNYLGSPALNYTSGPTILFSDSFTRSDSSTLGNGWGEVFVGSQADFAIASNKLRYTGKNVGAATAYHDAGGSITAGTKFTMTFTPVDWTVAGGQMRMLFFADNTYGSGYGLKADVATNVIHIVDGETVKADGSYTFTSGGGTAYNIELLRTTNGLQVRIWPTSGSRPSAPTLEHDNGSAYTPTASGSNISIRVVEESSDIGSMIFDDVLVQQ